jgi:hypothetical protein
MDGKAKKRGNEDGWKEAQVYVGTEQLLSLKQLAELAGIGPDWFRTHHLPRLRAKGLQIVKFVGGDTKYLASSWNKLVKEAAENGKEL